MTKRIPRTILRMQALSKLGFDPEDVNNWVSKWQCKKMNASNSNNDFNLTFFEYLLLAKEASIEYYGQIGRGIDQYALGRIGDVGGYDINNCRFIPVYQNIKELKDNGGLVPPPSRKGISPQTSKSLAKTVNTISKYFELNDCDGVMYVGHNTGKFCRENKHLGVPSQPKVSDLCLGKINSCKGWTGRYINKEEYDSYDGYKQNAI